MKKIFVTGIDTNIGKTHVAAILCKALAADYWKPIQSGELDNSDTIKVKRFLGKPEGQIHPEAFALKHPLSPHAAAEHEGIEIRIDDIHIPPTENTLIIEGAGGLMVPINLKETMIDLIAKLEAAVILVSKNYLGSINHTLLSVKALQNQGIQILGIVMVGDANVASEKAITSLGGVPILTHIEWSHDLSQAFITEQADKNREIFQNLLHQWA